MDEGVIFILKNINNEVNINNTNQLHPFYLVYVTKDKDIKLNHLNSKNILDTLRTLCKSKDEPIKEVYIPFNEETNDGKNMQEYSNLLSKAISSIVETKELSDIESLFSGVETTFLQNKISGLDDFELIAFVVVK